MSKLFKDSFILCIDLIILVPLFIIAVFYSLGVGVYRLYKVAWPPETIPFDHDIRNL